MSDKPRYSFLNVDGVLRDGYAVNISGDDDGRRVHVTFTYRDNITGAVYAVEASGYRTRLGECDA